MVYRVNRTRLLFKRILHDYICTSDKLVEPNQCSSRISDWKSNEYEFRTKSDFFVCRQSIPNGRRRVTGNRGKRNNAFLDRNAAKPYGNHGKNAIDAYTRHLKHLYVVPPPTKFLGVLGFQNLRRNTRRNSRTFAGFVSRFAGRRRSSPDKKIKTRQNRWPADFTYVLPRTGGRARRCDLAADGVGRENSRRR